MAKDTTGSKDPFVGLHFWVDIGGIQVAGFSECSGLLAEMETFEYVEGGENTYTHKLPVRVKYSNVTLKRGLDPGQDLLKWFENCMTGKVQRKNISIMLYGQEPGGSPLMKWDLRDAFPVKWVGPEMRSESGAVAVETLEIAHEGIVAIERGNSRNVIRE